MPENKFAKNSSDTLTTQQQIADGRGSTRQTVSLSAEIVESATNTRLACRVTDLSLGGCYVDLINPLEVDTDLHLRLRSQNRVFQTEARVLYATPGMGMGLSFTKTAPEHLEILRDWMRELGGEAAGPEIVRDPGFDFEAQTKSAAAGNLRAVVTELITLLARKQILSDPEAAELQKKLLRGAG